MSEKIFVPPIKIQGIKTKLVPVIKQNISINKKTLWIEPFMAERAIFADINPHIINFYNSVKSGEINSEIVRVFLQEQGKNLAEFDEKYYYAVRERFNETHNPLDFLFLNRSCFNGMIRFNKDYKFNVPYGHKPLRFSRAYITKIVNQVWYIEECLKIYDWKFVCQSFENTIEISDKDSFIYCDPPYIGRHVDYYDSWDEDSEKRLCGMLRNIEAKFMLSTWDYNNYRTNKYIDSIWNFCKKINHEHFYHLGAREINRHSMIEALLINYKL